jgi:hypothetical protein
LEEKSFLEAIGFLAGIGVRLRSVAGNSAARTRGAELRG